MYVHVYLDDTESAHTCVLKSQLNSDMYMCVWMTADSLLSYRRGGVISTCGFLGKIRKVKD